MSLRPFVMQSVLVTSAAGPERSPQQTQQSRAEQEVITQTNEDECTQTALRIALSLSSPLSLTAA